MIKLILYQSSQSPFHVKTTCSLLECPAPNSPITTHTWTICAMSAMMSWREWRSWKTRIWSTTSRPARTSSNLIVCCMSMHLKICTHPSSSLVLKSDMHQILSPPSLQKSRKTRNPKKNFINSNIFFFDTLFFPTLEKNWKGWHLNSGLSINPLQPNNFRERK